MRHLFRIEKIVSIILLVPVFIGCAAKVAPVDTSKFPAALEANGSEKLTFHSNLLNKDMGLYIHLPYGYDKSKQYPVVYLLHGFGNNEIEWFDYYGMDKVADTLCAEGKLKPVILVSVRMDNSWGMEIKEVKQLAANPRTSLYSGPYESYLIKEVLPMVESRYPVQKDAASRCIAGISMGGYSALHIGLRNPKIFGAIAGHSPALRGNQIPDWFLYAKDRPAEKNDPVLLAAKLKQGTTRLWLDCGEGDSLKDGVEQMRKALKSNGWTVAYSSAAGAHNSDYWIPRMGEYLAFYAGQ